MTIEDCARASRALEARLEAGALVSEQYVLEVSSPGADRGGLLTQASILDPMSAARDLVWRRRIAVDIALDDPVLITLRSKVSPETWARRIAQAKDHLAIIEVVEAVIA